MTPPTEFHVLILETPSLGDRSYVVHDGSVAVAIDPQRDIDRLLAAVAAASLRLTHVFETHVHNDYVSGGLALARRTGAEYVMCADDDARFERRGVADGDEIATGSLTIRAVHTPGHTHTHLSYVVSDGAGAPRAVFTGGSLLYGTVGRTDLLGDADTEELTRSQYRSGRRLVEELPDDVAVYPTHGFGSFCASSGGGDRTAGTIADERADNIAITIDDEERFVERLLAGLTEHPAYYAHMSLLNLAGPFEASLALPVPVDADELRRRLDAGEWVVDLRARTAFAVDHLTGSIGVELDDGFSTYLGWLIPWGSRVTLLAPTADDVAAAQRQLLRIGLDQLGGAAIGDLDDLATGVERAEYPVVDFAGIAAAIEEGRSPVVVDVRRRDEWQSGHVDGAHSLPLHELVTHAHHAPAGELWVHCASGYRAAIGASLLARAGFPVVLVDDEFDRAAAAGLHIVDPGTVS
jgi:glyoxylase-like metal-dependent hydrolase (beta-lactamase superfamily II)/rhodanese-related sulfurtransferase